MVDVDGRSLIDFALANGPLLLGHSPEPVVQAVEDQLRRGLIFGAQHQLEAEVAERLVEMVPCAEAAMLSVTGSEAVHNALRFARAATGRRLIVRFEGHYHGWINDIAFSAPPAPPVPSDSDVPLPPTPFTGGMLPAAELAVLRWNDFAATEAFFANQGSEVAAVILEPVPSAGLIGPEPGFLDLLRQLTTQHGAVLAFDEVITGFRLGAAGAQGYFGVTPDLSIHGKALGAGFPVSATVGRADILKVVRDGVVAPMGTFNGHPVSLAAAAAALDQYRSEGLHNDLEERTGELAAGIRRGAHGAGVSVQVQHFGAMAGVAFADPSAEIKCIADHARAADPKAATDFAASLLEAGVFVPRRCLFMVSAAHQREDISQAVETIEAVFSGL
jgi:glutamate-1-semialdehyde 2,1-aminomutase